MHIERTDAYNAPGMPEGAQALPKAVPVGDDVKKPGQPVVSSGESELSALARQAAATPEIREGAVAEARRLLESGQLANPEAIRRAAAALLNGGV